MMHKDTKYRIVRKLWFDEFGNHKPTDTHYEVQTYKPTIIGWRWITETHSAAPDGYQRATEFKNEQQAADFIMHISSGGAVQEWVRKVLPGDFG